MTRLIDLPVTLRELAVKNQIAETGKRDVYQRLNDSFSWSNAPQGPEPWLDASRGYFSETLKYRLDE